MNKADVLLGLQWGDEGKGKIVDVLTPNYDIIARFQGGPNAGHTLEFNGIKHVLHTIPSGIFHPTAINVVGNGVVIDPVIFKKEIDEINNANQAINVVYVFDDNSSNVPELQKGIITKEKATALINHLNISKADEFFICGPGPMMENVKNTIDCCLLLLIILLKAKHVNMN